MATQLFWDRIAPKYARKPVDDPNAYEEKLALAASLLKPGDRVLEIGCGTGTTALRLAPNAAHYTATDGSSAMIGIANAKLGADAPANVAFFHADAAESVAGAPFNAIFAFSLLHLVEDVPGVLAAVVAQLKPDGLFLSKTVCTKAAAWPIRAMIPALTALRIAPRVTPLSEADLVRYLEDAGFTIERTSHLGSRRMSPIFVACKPA
ncbi:class I SAM-dependent methyltransferase [Jannaschia sp. S6380]|uniref:class I SAM-dependent methyltransferase n=1 Tax=Jannaschia sp. S6380 TaxID=2926408 RepID=UPI001FF10B8F|nr:class I SAM-dependent methyltransferase [Jannaschia sp. S6380]MCK0166750.1 class I SAM-dependent methyltransferase [Jannaschia sp. S6380]